MKLEQKNKAIELRKNGISVRNITKQLGVSKSTVSLWVSSIKLTEEQKRKLSIYLDFDKQLAVKMFNDKISYKKISNKLGISKSSLVGWFNRNGFSRKYSKYEFCEICGRKNVRVMGKRCNSCTTSMRRCKNKILSVRYLGGKCFECNLKLPIEMYASYEFHHKNAMNKDFDIGSFMIKNWDKIKNELDKCVLLCSNCHRQKHNNAYSGIILEKVLKEIGCF